MNSGGYSTSKENEVNGINCWVPSTPNNVISTRFNPVPIELQGNNFETSSWQQLLEFPSDQLLESMNSYQSVQHIDPHQQVGRNGSQIFNPNSFMALLGVDSSYDLNSAILDDNQGINRSTQGYPNMHGNLSNGIDTSGTNSESLNPPWMSSQYVAQNRDPHPSQVVAQNRSFQQVNRPAIPNLNILASADLMENHSATMPMMNQNHDLRSSAYTASKDVFQLTEDHFLDPSRVQYTPNAPSRTETEPSFSQTLDYFHQSASATMNQASKLQENKQCDIVELRELNRISSQNGEKQIIGKQISLTENGMQKHNDLLQANGDTLSNIMSTPEKKMGDEKERGQVIDLDKTPHHKTPKRRKHRPKVIREGKPKKAPKAEIPKNSTLSEKPKRKYTRKKGQNASGSQPSDTVVETGGPTEEPVANSCRRALSFEDQKTAEAKLTEKISNTQPEQMRQMSRVEFDLNLDNQPTEICSAGRNMSQRDHAVHTSGQNETCSSIHPTQIMNNLAHSVHQRTAINNQHLVRPPPTRAATFQDLLMGNDNGANGMATVRKANLNLNSQIDATYSTEANKARAESTMLHKLNALQTLYQQTSAMGNVNYMPQQRSNISTHSERHPPIQATMFQDLLMGNQTCALVSGNSHIVNVNQNNCRPYYPVQRFTSAENNRNLALQTKNTHASLNHCGLMVLGRSNQPVMITSDGAQTEARRFKREREFFSEQQHFHGNASVNSSQPSRAMEGGYQSGYSTQQKLLEAEKRRRIENMLCLEMSSRQNQNFAENKSRQLLLNNGNYSPANMRPFNPFPWMSYPTNVSQSAEYRRSEGAGNGVSASSGAFNHYCTQLTSSGQPSNISHIQNMGNLTNVRASPSAVLASNRSVQHVPTKPLLVDSQQSLKNVSSTIAAKQYSRPTASGLLVKTIKPASPSGDTQAITKALPNGSSKNIASSSFVSSRKKGNDYQTSSSIKRGHLRKKDIRDLIDDIVRQMEDLNLDGVSKRETRQPENAIVLYQGDGPVVMYQAKKRKPRPKVDLDAESERVWKLLMGKEGPSDGTEADKEKWWEQERNVFKLRADAFISRMHLVQGDRRFSKWKGSVVDSVIGVFLTQNVSDHLSSSAFMSLAARFPLSLSSRASCEADDVISEEDPEICIIDLEDMTTNDDAKQNLSYGHFMASENEGKCMTPGTEMVNLADNKKRGGNNETISLDSFDSFISLISRGSSSGSNSEVEDQLSARNPSSLYKTDKPTEIAQASLGDSPLESPERSSHHAEKTKGASEKECQQLSSGESMSSCIACDASECSSNTSDLESQNRKNFEQNEHPMEKTEVSPNLNGKLGSHVVQQQGVPSTSPSKQTLQHPFNDHPLESLTFQSDKTSVIEGVTEPILREQGLSNAANINIKGSSPKMRKGKQDADKKTVDWDELRKEAQRKIKRSKNKNNMDSMDYETMRHAEVKEISNAIKERGMNNMLAERIKDFLNRLVTDHGSTDLEWLRDAPPDKAKDYLLSIRGLGLKSVECVRLLTLHHLAFPVDTNVGRIAVRLGWVPLQPLPESLQLHLLEMYPVLETIQKYLWPRLCKLDQRTLYELHYQMITFGKVFCTKSKPNCNACPMRAECRHFASAFASARLALPAPEERNIVPSGFSGQSDSGLGTPNDTHSRTFLEWDKNVSGVERFRKTNCEPIVEEPKTPEQEPEEVSEIDIEDSFGEDPDEIPTINLDVPKFSQTLQSYMHDNNIEVREGDMSKALVALTVEASSLQPQKLKNVSRLRTEHQVYELPDEHPLLKEMDKREPDDPSPYLLAIWTPGETAVSTQPPESRCQSDDPCNMCNEQTCFSCNSKREADSNIVRGTLLIPCRTAMRGSFPLNGTYFQVNEMFADHESSMNPISVPREWIWDLPRRTVYFGTSASTIFKGMTTAGIQYCFWRGFVCVRGFDQRYRAPRPLLARLHHPASKLVKKSREERN